MTETPLNPWKKLTLQNPFVLTEDKEVIDEYNRKCENTDFKLRLDVMPAPFVGDVLNSEIVILMLNPKFTEEGQQIENDNFRKKCLKVFTHQPVNYPFFCLDDSAYMGVGRTYWQQKLKEVINFYGSEKKTSLKVSNIQFHPYSSVKFKQVKQLPSQKYSFYLVRKAIERKAIIIVARGEKLWLENIPELKDYDYFKLNSYRNPTLSKKNCPALFLKLEKTTV